MARDREERAQAQVAVRDEWTHAERRPKRRLVAGLDLDHEVGKRSARWHHQLVNDAWVDGAAYTGDPRAIKLASHTDIVIEVGPPFPKPAPFVAWNGANCW